MTYGEHLQETHPSAYKEIANDPKMAPLLAQEMPPAGDDFEQHMAMLRMVNSRAPGYLEMVPAVAEFFSDVLTRGLDLRALPDSAVPRRPKEEGLPNALHAMIQARLRFGSTKLASLNLDPHDMRLQLALICAMREATLPTTSLLRSLMRNLARVEDGACAILKPDYEMVRAMANADPKLSMLNPVEQYFYGSAEKGAETRRDNRRTFEDMTVKAKQKGQADANRKARATLAEEFEGLIQDLRRTDPNGDKDDDRNTPR
jgi:hypothetical protein